MLGSKASATTPSLAMSVFQRQILPVLTVVCDDFRRTFECLENKIFQTHLVPVALYQVTYISFRFFKKKCFVPLHNMT